MFNRSATMTDDEKAELVKEILAVTPVNPKTPVKKGKLSAKAQNVLKVLADGQNNNFDSNRMKYLQRLTEAIMGEKLTVSDYITGLPRLKDDSLKKFMAIVPEENSFDHGYTLGKAVLVKTTGLDYCIKSNGSLGNHIMEEDCRYATMEEVTELVDTLQKNVDAVTVANLFKN
jgi:hypothetical protein